MKKTFEGFLYNRLEKLGDKNFNHVGCRGKNKNFIDFLTEFVPNIGMQRKVKFIVETIEDPQIVEKYKKPDEYKKEYDKRE